MLASLRTRFSVSSPAVSSQHWTQLLWTGIVLAAWLLLAVDTLGSPTTSSKILPVPSYQLIVPMLLLQIFVTQVLHIHLHPLLKRVWSMALLPGLIILTTVLTYLDFITPLNQVFAWTRLHQSQLGILCVYMVGLLLANQPLKWFKKNHLLVLALIPLITFFGIFVARLWPMNYFLEIVKEDRSIEWLQFWVLIVGSIGSGVLAWKAWKAGIRRWWMIGLLFGSIGFALIAGDEISWGQRLFGLATPESLENINRQGEITFHNTHYLEWLVGWAYLGLALAGILVRPLLQTILGKKNELASWAPHIWFAGYFLFPAIYHGYSKTTEFGVWRAWSEPIELFLYAGLAFWAVYRGWLAVEESNKQTLQKKK